MPHLHRQTLLAAGFALAAASFPSLAQTFPTTTVTFVATAPAGGSIDAVARLVAQDLTRALGQPVVVVNRAGAGGNIAADAVAKSRADGHTLLFTAASTLTINPWVYPTLSFDPEKSFVPVIMPARQNNILVVHPKLGVASVKDFVALMKAKPDALNYGSAGVGSLSHLAGVLFADQSGTSATHIAFSGIAPSLTALLAGQVDYMFDSATSLPHVRSGKLKALGVMGPNKLAAMPDVPTMRELGYPGMETARSWYGIFAPAGTPAEVVQRLNREIGAAMTRPELAEKVTGMGMEAATSTPEELGTALRDALKKWEPIVKRVGIKPT